MKKVRFLTTPVLVKRNSRTEGIKKEVMDSDIKSLIIQVKTAKLEAEKKGR